MSPSSATATATAGADRSLRSRLVLAMGLVAIVSAVLAGVLAAPLLRSATDDAVRSPLGQQAQLLAQLPRAALVANRVSALTSAQGLTIGVVTRRGEARGAAVALSAGDRSALLRGDPVSTTGTLAGRDVLLEGRPARVGGAVVLAADTDSVQAASRRLSRRVLLALGLALLAALATALVMARRLAEPLARTAAVARRLAAGERGVAMPQAGTSEVADVVDALRHLDRALAASEHRQRQFLMSVSHELRTPLTTVRGYAEALADDAVDGAELRGVGRTLLAESERLQGYVEELLALARLEADDFAMQLSPVDVAELVREAAVAWDGRCRGAGITLREELPDGGPLRTTTDGVRVRQVLDALADNAVRVCPAGAVVVLAARRTDRGVRLEVRDSGPGLTEDDATVAFEPGALHARYSSARPGGHGLGLAIVARLVARLGGTARVGRAPEGGAAFSVDLP